VYGQQGLRLRGQGGGAWRQQKENGKGIFDTAPAHEGQVKGRNQLSLFCIDLGLCSKLPLLAVEGGERHPLHCEK